MGDYNDHKLPDPCLRLDFGDAEFASIELGEGTGYIRRDIAESGYETELAQAANDLEAMKLYASNVRDLLVKVYGKAVWLLDSIPDEDKTVGDLKDMDELYRRIHELGIEIDK